VSKKTVLIVEDEPSIIASYLLLLETLDEEVIPLAVASYRRAREILAQESVDLIILDLMLQDAKATDVLGGLRKTHPNIPIFLVTGYPEELNLEKAGQFGITQFFVKPVHVEPFGQAIENTLQESA
jgi:DNA-binding NtrC family response regulator